MYINDPPYAYLKAHPRANNHAPDELVLTSQGSTEPLKELDKPSWKAVEKAGNGIPKSRSHHFGHTKLEFPYEWAGGCISDEVTHHSRLFKRPFLLRLGHCRIRISHQRHRDRSPLFLRCIPDIHRNRIQYEPRGNIEYFFDLHVALHATGRFRGMGAG